MRFRGSSRSRSRIKFNTFHPQGMVKIGDIIYLSSVDIRTPTKRYPQLQDGYDRDTGEGVGHLFKIDMNGNLLDRPRAGRRLGLSPRRHRLRRQVDLGAGGRIPSQQPGDHLPRRSRDDEGDRGASATAITSAASSTTPQDNTLQRRELGLAPLLHVDARTTTARSPTPARRPEDLRVTNPALYIDYQDCKYLGRQEMLCSGLNNYQMQKDAPRFPLGGLEIVDLATNRAVYQVPVELWTDSGLPMTQNPCLDRADGDGLCAPTSSPKTKNRRCTSTTQRSNEQRRQFEGNDRGIGPARQGHPRGRRKRTDHHQALRRTRDRVDRGDAPQVSDDCCSRRPASRSS